MATTADRALRPTEWRALAILGLPTFALALAITTVTTYLPVIASGFAASTVVIGVLIGGEGLLALGLPVVVGAWSDRLRTRIGGRLPFVLGATPPLLAALALLGFANSIATAAIVVAAFFVAYYVAYEPYRALYPDQDDDDEPEPPFRRCAPSAPRSPTSRRSRRSSARTRSGSSPSPR